MKPEAIPINFLLPIKGTPFGDIDTGLNPQKCLKILCLTRLLNPKSEVRAAGGWEYHMRSLKPLALYPADSIFVSGYLTTGGTSVKEVCDMIADMGFESTIEDSQTLIQTEYSIVKLYVRFFFRPTTIFAQGTRVAP